MTVTLRPHQPADFVMYAMTRDDWQEAMKAWNSTD
jgi:hypothetical protein